MRKKLLSLVLVATMVAGMAVGCGKKADDAGAAPADHLCDLCGQGDAVRCGLRRCFPSFVRSKRPGGGASGCAVYDTWRVYAGSADGALHKGCGNHRI